jgi:hemerythrin
MKRAVWSPTYETGHPRIDAEHRIFVDLIGRIEVDVHSGVPIERIIRRVTELLKFADFHFYSEEGLMIDVGFPDTRAHRQLHAALVEELRGMIPTLAADLREGHDLVGFLIEWFAVHSRDEDARLAAFVLNDGS